MISFASLLVLVALPASTPADTVPPPLVVAQARALVAATWHAAPEALVLEWGRLPTMPDSLEGAALRLGGTGRDGWFVVTITPTAGHPVAITLRAGVPRTMPVATSALPVGREVTVADIDWVERVAWGPPNSNEQIDPVGWQVRRGLQAGDVLAEPMVRAPLLVLAGEPVTFVWERGSVRMERVALAQSPAREGDLVRAQVGGTRLTGRVIGPGVAILEESP
ncbi:MAG TPA: flagella basal body P-ring formation protein FlgA [Gemmatimonadales bacterium]|nr:flagella basal body P-ring formation protein FlgA [Gemmatimonadales bacterium]